MAAEPVKPQNGPIATQAPKTADPPQRMDLAPVARSVLFQKVTQEQILASLPPDMDHAQFAALFLDSLSAMVAANPNCENRVAQNPGLIARAAQRCAAMGAIPGKGAKEVALIFRNGWRKNNGDQVPDSIDVMVEWRLYMRKMRGAVGVADIETVLVHESDNFAVRDGIVYHDFDPFNPERTFLHPKTAKANGTSNGLRGVYTVARLAGGGKKYHFTTAAKIEASRLCSGSADSGPWLDWYPEMVRKAALRDAAAAQFVAWSPLQVDEISRIMATDDTAQDNDPSRGGYNKADAGALDGLGAAIATKPVRQGVDRLSAALGLKSEPAPQQVDFHTAAPAERETVANIDDSGDQHQARTIDPMEYCPVCSKHYPDLRGEMDTTTGCPSCQGKKPK